MKKIYLKHATLLVFLASFPAGFSAAKESFLQKVVKFTPNAHNHFPVLPFPSHNDHQQGRNDHDHDGGSCGRGPASRPVPPGSCSSSFDKRIHAIQIKNSSLVYFDIKELDFLRNSTALDLKDVELEVTFKGRMSETQTVTISLNGFKTSRIGGHKKFQHWLDYLRFRDESHGRFKLHDLSLNGAESFDHFLARLKRNKGYLRIALHGRYPRVIDAYVTFKGIAYFPCPPPPSDTTTTTTSTTTTTITVPGPTTTTTTTTTTLPPEDLSKYQVQIDSVNPAESTTSSTSMVISFSTVNTDGSYFCSLDQAVFEKCQSPVSLAGLGNGIHTFQVYAQTPRGTATNPAAYSWTVDTVPPEVSITNLSSLASLTNQTTITFQFASTKPGTFKCSLDNAVPVVCASPMTYSAVPEGLHDFSVTAIDSVGNISGSAAQFQWSVDLTPPIAFISSMDPSEDITGRNTKSFIFAANETSNFECSIDHAGFSVCQSPLNLSELSEGSHWFEMRATDLAGNVGATVSSSWTTDYTSPILTLGTVSPAQGLTNANALSVEFFSSEPGKIFCQWDSQAASECASPFQTALSDGAHQLSIFAVDAVGHESNHATLNWTVDATAPVVSFGDILPSTASNLNTNTVSLAVNVSENVSLSASLNGAPLEPLSNPIQLSNLAEGSYTVQVSGYDSAGNLSNTISHTFVIDMTAPAISLESSGGSLVNVDSRAFDFSANETVNFQCALDDAGFEPCQSPKNYSGLADGDHKLIVMATDLAGNVSLASSSWTVDTTAPTTLQSHNQVRDGITFSLGSSESNVTYQCSMDGQAFTACSSPVSYTGLAVGSHTFIVRATDSAGNTDPVGASYSFTVQAPIKTTITSTSPSGSVVNSSSMSISFTADQSASGFMCSLDGAALSACSSPASYSGLAQGKHTFLVKAMDAYGTLDTTGASMSWSIDSIAPAVSGLTTSSTTNTITVTWFTSEPATAKIIYGVGTAQNQATAETTVYATSQSIKLTGLSSNTTYSIKVTGRDAAGNIYNSVVYTVKTNR